MNKLLVGFFTLLLPIFCTFTAIAQPSYSIGFAFKLYDRNGKPVDYERFCNEFKFTRADGTDDQTPCTNENIDRRYFYNDTTMLFLTRESVVYSDSRRKIIHGADTMMLILKGGFSIKSYTIDSLTIKPGGFIVCDEHLHHIDYCKSGALYYNYFLKEVVDFMQKQDSDRYKDNYFFRELSRLKRIYGIAPDDFDEKTSADLCK